MTSWRYVTHLFLFVLLSKINLSKGGCHDYFNINSWAKNLTETISLVKTKNSEDIVECTVERECLQGRNICHILYQCFQRTVKEISEKCKGTTFQTVPYYHFMCLTARAFNHIPEGCKYETVCELYRKEPSTVFDQTTLAPPPPPTTTTTTTAPTTTLPERTTAPPTTTTTAPPPTTTAPTATLPERTTAATTVLPPTTAASTTMAPSATLKSASLSPSPTTVSQRADSKAHGQTLQSMNKTGNNNAENTEILTLKILLMISVAFHVLVPLAVYRYMRRQVSAELSDTLPASVYGNQVENSHLMQVPCQKCCCVEHLSDISQQKVVRLKSHDDRFLTPQLRAGVTAAGGALSTAAVGDNGKDAG
ncbi:PIH1 domain-containing protein 1 isoform X2 [Chelmon rostratus]|uniref:PIH1 domain-containing protein 1 isoform X2 n=1 Tax=Chelmon rostratus TaxID=109905 RepID=UPI001BE6ED8C|nr:PIH1 domain-containing protein 1 isoform X2 [Chelmon rostratus]